jgi:predicted Zn-dependent protease
VFLRVEEEREGRRHERQDKRMYDEHRKGARVQYLGLQTDIEHNQFHQAEKWFRRALMRQGKKRTLCNSSGNR